jgi:hypothetical protein
MAWSPPDHVPTPCPVPSCTSGLVLRWDRTAPAGTYACPCLRPALRLRWVRGRPVGEVLTPQEKES